MSTPSPLRSVLAATAVAAALIPTAAPPAADACGGTPPPFFCGKTYVFAKAIDNANVPAGVGGTVTVQTLHFLNLIEFNNGCPSLPASLSMTATLDCNVAPDAGPFVFGPFNLNEGFTTIPINIPVAAGPQRQCLLEVVADLTFSDGMVIRQQADQTVCVVESVPGDPATPLIDVDALGVTAKGAIYEVAPSGSAVWDLVISNNSPDQDWIGTLDSTITMVSDEPETVAGASTPSSGTFAPSDPLGNDTWLLQFVGQNLTFVCDTPPPQPWLVGPQSVSTTVSVPAGQSTTVRVGCDTYPLCANGSCGEIVNLVSGQMADGTPADACAGTVVAVNTGLPMSTDPCPETTDVAWAAAADQPGTPGVALSFDLGDGLAGQVDYRVFEDFISLTSSGTTTHTGTTSFSGPTSIDGQFGRLNPEISFIDPLGDPDATYEFSFPMFIQSGTAAITSLDIIDLTMAEGTGDQDRAPFFLGIVDVGFADGRDVEMEIIMQVSANGVENGSFNPVPMSIIDIQALGLGTSLDVALTAQASTPGTTPFVGFSTSVDLRAVVREKVLIGACCFGCDTYPGNPVACQMLTFEQCCAVSGLYAGDGTDCSGDGAVCDQPNPPNAFSPLLCQSDLNGDGRVDVFDFSTFTARFGMSANGRCDGDLNCDGTVNIFDFSDFIANFGCDSTSGGGPLPLQCCQP